MASRLHQALPSLPPPSILTRSRGGRGRGALAPPLQSWGAGQRRAPPPRGWEVGARRPCESQTVSLPGPATLARPGASHGRGGGAVTSSPSAHRAPRGRGHGGQSGNCLTWCGSRPASLLGRQGCVGKRGRPWEESMRRHTHAHADTRTHTHAQRPKRKPLSTAPVPGLLRGTWAGRCPTSREGQETRSRLSTSCHAWCQAAEGGGRGTCVRLGEPGTEMHLRNRCEMSVC